MADVRLVLDGALADLDLVAPRRSPRRGPWAAAAAAIAVLAVGAAGWQWLHTAATPSRAAAFRRITTGSGLSAFPAISRDGNLIAYASDQRGGNLDIYVSQVSGREAVRLTDDPADDSDPNFSVDGSRVAFRSERSGGGIWAAPSLGGEAVLLAPHGRTPRYSPDGRWLAYWEGRESQDVLAGSAHVFLMEAGGGQPRALATDLAASLYQAWSPQSDTLVVLGRKADEQPDWWIVPVNGGASRKTGALAAIETRSMLRSVLQGVIRPLEWRPTGVLFSAGTNDYANLWEYPLPGGPARAVTQGPGYQLHAAAASRKLVFSHLDWRPRIMALPLAPSGAAVQPSALEPLMGAEQPDSMSPSPTPDGKLVAYRSLDRQLWSVRVWNAVTGKDTALVSGPTAPYNPRIAGNGSVVAYSDRLGNIFSVMAAGGSIRKLCSECGVPMGLNANGNLISFEPIKNEDLTYFDAARKTTVKVADRPADVILSGGRFSPDGLWIAFHARFRNTTAQVFVLSLKSALPVPRERWIAITGGQNEDLEPAWSPEGSVLYYLSDRDGFRCIWAQRLDPATRQPSGEAFEAAPFHTARTSLKRLPGTTGFTGLSVIPGRLVFALGELTGNIWLEEK
jgi:Tol biopolymer transport system component